MTMSESQDITRDTRVDLYLSGGGYRAALGAVGACFFLDQEGRWDDVRRIVSVSGGGLINASIALTRPGAAELPSHLSAQFQLLTSRSATARAGAMAGVAIVAAACAGAIALPSLGDSWFWSPVGAITAVLVMLPFAMRIWLFGLLRHVVGDTKLGDLTLAKSWPVEHVFVASDLSAEGSVFFTVNCIRSTVASLRQGVFDARHLTFRRALRATTALPPVLPPVRVPLDREDPFAAISGSPATQQEWAYQPGFDEAPKAVWLTDGGITGNLGIQFDSALAPDNVALLEWIGSVTKAGTPPSGMPYNCVHGEIAWLCRECKATVIIVDSSGAAPRRSAWIGLLVNVPLIGSLVYGMRALQLCYESSLADDQSHAGDHLVGVVRTRQLFQRLAIKNSKMGSGQSASATHDMVSAGGYLQMLKHFSDPAIRALHPGFSPLLHACVAARESAALVKTGLHAVPAAKAGPVVASAYLNACLNTHGPGAIDVASRGIADLASILGPDAKLEEWWQGVLSQIPVPGSALPQTQTAANPSLDGR